MSAHYVSSPELIRIGLWSVAAIGFAVISALVLMRQNGYGLLSVQTDSMAPAIREGEAVLVVATDRDVRTGEVVSFASPADPSVIITHRILSVDWERGFFTARGDNSDMIDRPVPLANLRGTVRYAVPFAGYASDAFRHPVGILLMVYVPALVIVMSEVKRLARHYGGQNPRRNRMHRHDDFRVRAIHYSLYAR